MTSASAAAEEQPTPTPSDNTIDAQIDEILSDFLDDTAEAMDEEDFNRRMTATQEAIKEATQAIHSLTTQARIEELELMKSYDWFGEDDSGMPIYFNDEMTTYANARLKELEGQL